MDNSILFWALKYMRVYSVIPVGDDKKPLIPWLKYQNEKATEVQIREWFDRPSPPNIGIVTGKISGLTVVDVEAGGKWNDYPVTQTARTGGGGVHLYYRYAEGVQNKARIRDLTDIRGDGGYVVAPPSVHKSGNRYEWLRKEITQPFPYGMFNLNPEAKNKAEWDEIMKGVNQGGRNQTAAQIIGKFIQTLPPEDWMTTAWNMTVIWNQSNQPPLPERELRATFNSIVGREVRNGKARQKQPESGTPQAVSEEEVDIKLMSQIAGDITDDMTVSYPTGFKVIDDSFKGGLKEGDLFFITGYSGLGKCHGKGTKILMYDGSIKNVEDIKVGDQLMGDDSEPRNVLSLARGRENMYEVFNPAGKTESYTVNESHILSLYNSGYQKKHFYHDISVRKLLEKSKTYQSCQKGYKVPVDFDWKPLLIDPYFLGIWLGDGDTAGLRITTMDSEVVEEIQQMVFDWKLTVTVGVDKRGNKAKTYDLVNKKNQKNPLLEEMRNLDLIGNKHIPNDYKINNRLNRLELLAGLIDSDGYANDGCIEWTSHKKNIAEDFVFLCRSLGFHAQLKIKKVKQYPDNTYYRVVVTGNLSEIPLRVERRKGLMRKQIKNHLNYGIELKELGVGDYYGFEIDGNHRYLLGDFTVTHNTTFAQSITYNLDKANQPTMWFTFEVPIGELWRKFKDMEVSDNFQAYAPEKIPTRNIDWVKKKIIEARDRFKTKVVFIDHLGFLAMEPDNYDKNLNSNLSSILTMISRQLKTLAIQEKIAIVLLGHVRKPDTKKGDSAPTQHDIKDSAGVAQESDAVIVVHRKRKTGQGDFEDSNVYEPGTNIIIDKNRRTGATKTFKVELFKGRLMDDDEYTEKAF